MVFHSPPVGHGSEKSADAGFFLGVIILRKSAFFIDGFNLYHSLDNIRPYHKYKWLNLWKLSELLLLSNEELQDVYYFSAYTYWNDSRKLRHQNYVLLNKNCGCKVILGKFMKKDRTSMVECNTPCKPEVQRYCRKKYIAHEEKMTDVNIAVNIVKSAALKTYEAIYLLSGDNDLIPSLKTALEISPDIKIRVVLPINAKAKSLMSFCSDHSLRYIRIKESLLSSSQFPDPVFIKDLRYDKPEHWN